MALDRFVLVIMFPIWRESWDRDRPFLMGGYLTYDDYLLKNPRLRRISQNSWTTKGNNVAGILRYFSGDEVDYLGSSCSLHRPSDLDPEGHDGNPSNLDCH